MLVLGCLSEFRAGGASQSIGELMSVSGASNTVLEVALPYSTRAMEQLLGQEPEKYVGCDCVLMELGRMQIPNAHAYEPRTGGRRS